MSGVLPPYDATSLVGRERELAALRERLDAARGGRGGLVLIGGEAGIGKTALAEALCREATELGALVLAGHCYDLAEAPPYGPWAELFLRHYPEGGTPLPPAASAAHAAARAESQAELFQHVLDSFAALAAARPLVLLLDDLHWADDASVDLLRFVARSLPGMPMLVIGTYRSDELTRHHPLHRAVPPLAREGRAARMELQPLDEGDLYGLTRQRYALSPGDAARLVAYLAAHAEGNPFYAGELLRTLEEARTLRPAGIGADGGAAWTLGDLAGARVPPLLRQVIEARIDRLGPEARGRLLAAAIVGQEVPLDLWAVAAAEDEADLLPTLEGALEARLLAETDDGIRFAHALVREALYEGVLGPRRRALHRRVAEALLGRAPPGPDADAVAHHLQRAADPRATAWLVRAGDAAQARHAPRAAIDRFTRALDDSGVLASETLLRVRRARGRAHETVGEFDAARADYEQSLDLARTIDDQRAEWQALLDLGMLWAARDYARTETYYQRALALAREADVPALAARSLNRLGNWYVNMDRPRVSERYHAEALGIFRALDDGPGIAETLDFLAMAMMLSGNLRRAEGYGREAIERYRALDNRHGLSSVLATMAGRAGTLFPGMFTPVTTLAEGMGDAAAALEIARDIGWRAGEVFAMNQVAMNWAQRGEFGRALAGIEEEERIATAIGHRMWLLATHWLRAQIYFALLAPDVARRHGAEHAAIARELRSVYAQRGGTISIAWALLHAKEYAEADRLLEIVTGVEFVPDSCVRQVAWAFRAEVALARGDAGAALGIIDRLLAAMPNVAPGRPPVWPAIVRGESLVALGRVDEAEAGLRAAVRDAVQQEMRPYLWRAHVALGGLYRRQARDDDAAREFAAARAVAGILAATVPDEEVRAGFLAGVERLIAAAQVSVAEPEPRESSRLTEREVEVLRLVAAGMSNRAIAAALSISERTVNRHMTNLYTKIDAHSKAEATAYAFRHRLA